MTDILQKLVDIISCGVNEKKYAPVSGFDYESLFQHAKRHSLEALVGVTLKNSGIALSGKWEKAVSTVQFRHINCEYETELLTDWMESQNISYMLMKGAVLQKLYPEEYMRQKNDVDIYVDPAKMETVHRYMLDNDFTVVEHGSSVHNVYTKKPATMFEIHRRLLYKGVRGYSYYHDMSKLLKNIPGKNECRLSPEDFYIYFILHAYKHWKEGGVGLRTLVDIYLYTERNELDWDYLKIELSKLKIIKFERNLRGLASRLFGEKVIRQLSPNDEKMLSYIFDAGTFGNIGNAIKHADNKAVYFIKRLFPGADYFRERYIPYHGILLPVYWIKWVCKNLFFNRNMISKFLKGFKK